MATPELTAPFPYFGSKRLAASMIWQAFGDVASYCEPFAGSCAVLLRRPGEPGRIETINDLSGHVANFWRSVRQRPDDVAEHLDYPVIEQDLHARHRWLLARHPDLVAGLDADPDWCDPKAAGWWAWGMSSWIGSGFCDPSKRPSPQLPNMAVTGKGVHVRGQLPHLSSTGAGAHVRGQLPFLGNAGRSVHSVGAGDAIHGWVAALAVRLRRVRVCCGGWRRVVTHSALCDRLVGGRVGILYDPPYAHATEGDADGAAPAGERASGLYGAEDDASVAAAVAEHARRQASEFPRWRIVLCGYAGEHVMPGWREVAWSPAAGKWGSGGYGRRNGNPERERLWLSPACLPVETEAGRQQGLFGAV